MTRMMIVGSLGDYRANTMRLLNARLGKNYSLYAGTVPAEPSIRTLSSSDIEMHELRNIYLPRGILLQNIPLAKAIAANVVILDLNPRVPHVWLLLLLRNALRRRTILWGHAWPRAGRGSKSDKIRGILRSLSTGLICYTRTQAGELRAEHPGKDVYAAPNAVVHHAQMGFDLRCARNRFLYSGRLTESKRVDLMIPAFERIAALDENVRLTIVGDGPLFPLLSKQRSSSPAKDRIELLGYLSDYEKLRQLYAESIASLSPGYVGLSITQSLGFGVPMIISRNEAHSPEIEAATEGENATFFDGRGEDGLAAAMARVSAEAGTWASRGPRIAAEAQEKYSVEAMVSGLEAALLSR